MIKVGILFLIVMAVFTNTQIAHAEKTKQEIAKQKTVEAYDATVDYTKEQKDKFQNEMENSLEDISKQIKSLKAKVNDTADETQGDLKVKIKELEKKQSKLNNDLKKLSHQTGKAWSQLKDGMSSAWKDLSESYEKAKNEYK